MHLLFDTCQRLGSQHVSSASFAYLPFQAVVGLELVTDRRSNHCAIEVRLEFSKYISKVVGIIIIPFRKDALNKTFRNLACIQVLCRKTFAIKYSFKRRMLIKKFKLFFKGISCSLDEYFFRRDSRFGFLVI